MAALGRGSPRSRTTAAGHGAWLADGHRAVIDVFPNLIGGSSGSDAQVQRRLPASVLHLAPGIIDVGGLGGPEGDWIGLLIVDGLLLTDVDAGRAHAGWLLGSEDIVRPWDMTELSLTQASTWRALTPVRVALLDRDFGLRAGGLPILARAIATKMFRTVNWLLAQSLVLSPPLVEERLLLCFALLGERWGKVNHQGVLLRLPLTHALLAKLCSVRRPSVTLALQSLSAAGLVTRTSDDAWLLHRRCAEELKSRPSCWTQYADALGMTA